MEWETIIMFKKAMTFTGMLAAVALAQGANATVVDFEELTPDSTYATPLLSGGLVFENPGIGEGDEFFSIISLSSNGTITLAPNYFGSVTTVSAEGGALFTLESFDFSDAFDFADDPIQVDFTFNTTSGVVNYTAFADFTPGMQTETFNISGISSFSFVTSGSFFGEDTIQTDNWVYSLDDTGPSVPEPATWAMMIGGFALAGAAMRRRTINAACSA